MKPDKELELQSAIRRVLSSLVGWATYAGFIYCLVKWPMRAIAIGAFMVATNVHAVSVKLGKS